MLVGLWSDFVVQSLNHVQVFVTSWTAAHQAPLSSTISWGLLMSVESVMPPNHLTCCCPLLRLPLIFPSIRRRQWQPTPVLCPPHAKSWLIGKDPDAGKRLKAGGEGGNRGQDVGWHHWLNGHAFEQTPGDSEGQRSWHAAVRGLSENQTELRDSTITTMSHIQGKENCLTLIDTKRNWWGL